MALCDGSTTIRWWTRHSLLYGVIPTGEDNYLEEIDRHWIQHIEDYDTRNKHYKDNDHGGYAINVVFLDVEESLGRPRLMDDGNESLIDDGDTDKLCEL